MTIDLDWAGCEAYRRAAMKRLRLTDISRTLRAAVQLAIALAAIASAPTIHAQESTQGVLLLKSPTGAESVMVGRITAQGNRYEIRIAADSRVWVPQDQVLFIGQTLEEVYEFKRRSIANWGVGDHYQLTRWCLQHDLPEQASAHYMAVAKNYSNHPRVKQLSIELQKKLLEDDEFRGYLGLPPLAQLSAPSELQSPNALVAPAGHQASVAALPPEIAQHFSQRIQPILRNRCSQAACHGNLSNNKLRILEPYGGAYARITAGNLESVLGFVGDGSGEVPELVRYATSTHGLQTEPGISFNETVLLDELRAWSHFVRNPIAAAVALQDASQGIDTYAVTAAGAGLSAGPVGPGLTAVRPGGANLRQVPPESGDASTRRDASIEFPMGDVAPTEAEIDALDRQLRELLGTGAAFGSGVGSPSRDPFDPAEFNRKSQLRATP